jgi:hypothetical protein
MISRRLHLIAALVLTIALVPALARGPQKQAPTVECTQAGYSVTEVDLGTQFAVSGTGYRANLPVVVCFNDAQCRHTDVDGDGEFYDGRSLYEAGTYTITVKQARNRKLNRWDLKATGQITVGE